MKNDRCMTVSDGVLAVVLVLILIPIFVFILWLFWVLPIHILTFIIILTCTTLAVINHGIATTLTGTLTLGCGSRSSGVWFPVTE